MAKERAISYRNTAPKGEAPIWAPWYPKTVADAVLMSDADNETKTLTGELEKLETSIAAKIPTSAKGSANGVAELDGAGKVPAAQLPSFVDDILDGYLYNGKFYSDNAHTKEYAAESGKIYVNLSEGGKTYRWSGTAYAAIPNGVALGETSSTAYRGDRGKAAYDHSQAAHAPANAEQNVQSDWSVTDTSSDAFIKNKPASLPANGGNADTVSGHTVKKDVPENAVFTDTKYSAATQSVNGLMAAADKKKLDGVAEEANKYIHPSTHAASMITQDATHRFVTDAEKSKWNEAQPEIYFAKELPTSAPAGSICFII